MFHQCLNKSQWCGRLVQCDLPELVIMRSAVILLALSLHLSSGFIARVRHDGSWFHSPLHIDHAHTTEPLADPTTVATDHIHRSPEFSDAHPMDDSNDNLRHPLVPDDGHFRNLCSVHGYFLLRSGAVRFHCSL